MKRNNLIAGITLTAGLAAGGIGGALLGIPGVSGAQTDTTPPTEQQQPAPPTRGPGGGGCHRGPGLEAAATALNMSVEDLRAQLRDGKTIAAVAKEKGVDVQKVIDAMVADATQHIDQAVKNGKLTADQAAQRKQNLVEKITRGVNEGRPQRGAGPPPDAPPAD
jgi:ribosomal protein S20